MTTTHNLDWAVADKPGRDGVPTGRPAGHPATRTPVDGLYEDSLAAALRGVIGGGVRTVMVTSCAAGEGKSTVTARLAQSVARSGRESVVAVDADPFRPSLPRAFGLRSGRGLWDLLSDVYLADFTRERDAQFGPGDWFEALRAQRRTGDLTLREGEHECSVRFVRGVAVCVRNRRAEPHDLLGERLVRRGAIAPAQCEAATRLQNATGRMFGEILEGLGCASREEISAALREQAADRLSMLALFSHPECRFAELADPFLPAAGGRAPVEPSLDGIDALLNGRLRHFLRDPFLSSQLPAYLSDTSLRNLKVLTHGTRPCDFVQPAHLAPFSLLLARLARIHDLVLVDAPPVALTTPTVSLARAVDGVVLVVRAGVVHRQAVKRSAEELRRGGAHLLGVVLNGVDVGGGESLAPYYRIAASSH